MTQPAAGPRRSGSQHVYRIYQLDGLKGARARRDRGRCRLGKRRLDDKTEEQTALEAKVERLEAALADEKTANNANKAKAEALEASNAEIWAELRRLGAARA